ncbi:MAG: HAD family hydrolase [Spirochaetales bacterium]
MDKRLFDLINKSEAIIFDFDGTVADTEPYAWAAISKAFASYGIIFDDRYMKEYIGQTDRVVFEVITKDFNKQIDFDAYMKQKIAYYIESAIKDGLKPFGYVAEVLETFKNKKFFILSSNKGEAIKAILNHFGTYNHFAKIYSMLDTNLNKEHCIKNSEEFFNVPSNKLIIFEDSYKTINMAKKYGAKTVLIENELNKNFNCDYDYKINLKDITNGKND